MFIEPHVAFGQPKDWGFVNWQAVVNELRQDVAFIQPDYGMPLLSGVTPYPSASFLAACALLGQCHLYAGPEGGLHHAAAALNVRAVVIFGGRIHPRTTGYATHTNLYVDMPGSPCGMIAECAHCADCFSQIHISDVVAAIRAML